MIDRTKPLCDYTNEELLELQKQIIASLVGESQGEQEDPDLIKMILPQTEDLKGTKE